MEVPVDGVKIPTGEFLALRSIGEGNGCHPVKGAVGNEVARSVP